MKLLLLTFIFVFVFSLSAFAQLENDREKGVELFRQGEYEKAIGILQNSVKTQAEDRLAWIYLGASFVRLKDDDNAVKAFRKTSVIYKKNLPVYEKELKILSKSAAAYTEAARRNRVSGTVKVAVEFGADGKIGFVFPFQVLSDGLTEKAVNAAKAIKFESAVKNGKPVTVVKTLDYSFSTF
jgi:tetratricopeptide (TPR) repeat protein